MYINKILKFYMVTILTITTAMAIGQTNFFDTYLPVVSGNVYQVFNEQMSKSSIYSTEPSRLLASVLPVNMENEKLSTANTGKYTVNVYLKEVSPGLFASPGSKNVELMNLHIKSFDANVELKSLIFDVTEIGNVFIERVYLFDGENKIADTNVFGNSARFSSLSYKSSLGAESVLTVKIDLSEKSSPGARVKLSVDVAENLSLLTEGRPHDFKRLSPIEGPYLSIVKADF